MQRRHFLFLAPLLPSTLFAPRLLRARGRQSPPTHNLVDETNQLNRLASNIHTLPDARRFIDAIAELFQDDLPPAWATDSFRSRLAQGEYLTVINPQKRLTEEHLAQTWNAYVTTIHASDESHVSAAEIHILRAKLFATGRAIWNRGYRNFWMLPSIFATQPDGPLAPASRLIESFRMFYDLSRFPENVRGIRENLRAGNERASSTTPSSGTPKQARQNPSSYVTGHSYLEMRASSGSGATTDPAEAAAMRERSAKALISTVDSLLNTVLRG